MHLLTRRLILDERLKASKTIDNFATKILILQQNGVLVDEYPISKINNIDLLPDQSTVVIFYCNSIDENINWIKQFSWDFPNIDFVAVSDQDTIPLQIRNIATISCQLEEFKKQNFLLLEEIDQLKHSFIKNQTRLLDLVASISTRDISEIFLQEWVEKAVVFTRLAWEGSSFELVENKLDLLQTKSSKPNSELMNITEWVSDPADFQQIIQYRFFGFEKIINLSVSIKNSIIDKYTVQTINNFFTLFQNSYLRMRYCIELDRVGERFALSQKALIQAEKLSVAGKMTASIAHEINNPLQGVKNCLHLLSSNNITEEQKSHYLEMTNQEMDRLTTTVQQMLEFYRPNENFSPVQVLEVLEHTLNLLENQLTEQKVRVTTIWPPRIPLISGIKNQIEQVFINLIINAKDAMPGGGELTLTIESAKPFLAIIFEDSGNGVPEDLREKIFEPFISTKGTSGLGLSVCSEIIKNHSGILELMNKIPNHGARFKIILPIKP